MLKMRPVSLREKNKRGCAYCKDMKLHRIPAAGGVRTCCPHDKCPYQALDKYDTYEDFMASDDAKILVDGFFLTVPSIYELSNGNTQVKQIYRQGESRVIL